MQNIDEDPLEIISSSIHENASVGGNANGSSNLQKQEDHHQLTQERKEDTAEDLSSSDLPQPPQHILHCHPPSQVIGNPHARYYSSPETKSPTTG
ncbi:hypothetical protein LINGRAHAP2_LOCUS31706 [Linum grandiflorum]